MPILWKPCFICGQDYWVSGLCQLSNVLKNMFQKLDLFASSGERTGGTYSVESVRKNDLQSLELKSYQVLSKEDNIYLWQNLKSGESINIVILTQVSSDLRPALSNEPKRVGAACHFMWAWTDDWIYSTHVDTAHGVTLQYSSLLHMHMHIDTHTRTHARTLVSTVTSSLQLLDSSFQRQTSPFLWVPEMSPAPATEPQQCSN
jgi:hypothetical protein